MFNTDIVSRQSIQSESKLLLVILDGLGDLPDPENDYKTPLEAARTPNLDRIVPHSALGRLLPVTDGITPGSGPSHLALFGYNPIKNMVGRGVLEAFGLGMDVSKQDVAIRANFCTLDEDGRVKDRRAGRIPSDLNMKLCSILSEGVKEVEGVRLDIAPGLSHRFVVVLKGRGLGPNVTDTDPQHEGAPPLRAKEIDKKSAKTARIANILMDKFRNILKSSYPANGVLFRGFSSPPDLEPFNRRFKLRAGAIATYPMYRGLAKLVGMDVLESGSGLTDEFNTLKKNYNRYDFFYFHVKDTDIAGEDGDFKKKVSAIEDFDRILPSMTELKPDVLAITGDHCTPVIMKRHSWHPVPLMIAAGNSFRDGFKRFTEKNCIAGSIGNIPMINLIPLLLAHAGRLEKFGA